VTQTYHRFTRKGSKSPFPPEKPWGLFADDIRKIEYAYGPVHWTVTDRGAVDVEDLLPAIATALDGRPDILHEYGCTALELAPYAVPEDIVGSGGLWDEPTLVQLIWDEVLESRGITKVRTPDGLVVLDARHVKRAK